MRRLITVITVLIAFMLSSVQPVGAGDPYVGCKPYTITSNSPTGIVGCVVYGEGIASRWGGPGAARNDCVYPWNACQAVSIRSLSTGIVIVVTPTMYCDCYTGAPDERIVDLDPSMVSALGLSLSDGLYPVEVLPIDGIEDVLPNTATEIDLEGQISAATGISRSVSAELQSKAAARVIVIQSDFSHANAGVAVGQGEVIGWDRGYEEPLATVVKSWIAAPTHSVLLLDPYYTQIGCAWATTAATDVQSATTWIVCWFERAAVLAPVVIVPPPYIGPTIPNTAMENN